METTKSVAICRASRGIRILERKGRGERGGERGEEGRGTKKSKESRRGSRGDRSDPTGDSRRGTKERAR